MSGQNIVIDLVTPPPSPTVVKNLIPEDGLLQRMYRPEVLLWHMKVYDKFSSWMNPDPENARRAHESLISFCSMRCHEVSGPTPPLPSELEIPAYAQPYVRNSTPTDLMPGYQIDWEKITPLMAEIHGRVPELNGCVLPIKLQELNIKGQVKKLNEHFLGALKAAVNRRNLYTQMMIIGNKPITEDFDEEAKEKEISSIQATMAPLEDEINKWLEFAARLWHQNQLKVEHLQKKRREFVKYHLKNMLMLLGKLDGEAIPAAKEASMRRMYCRYKQLRDRFYQRLAIANQQLLRPLAHYEVPAPSFKQALALKKKKTRFTHNGGVPVLTDEETRVPLQDFVLV